MSSMASLADLQKNPFEKRSEKEKLALVRADRWKPLGSREADEEMFKLELTYARVDWLACCPQTSQFFCWPCVLFGKTTGKNAVKKVTVTLANVSEHARDKTHPKSVKSWTEFQEKNCSPGTASHMEAILYEMKVLEENLPEDRVKLNHIQFYLMSVQSTFPGTSFPFPYKTHPWNWDSFDYHSRFVNTWASLIFGSLELIVHFKCLDTNENKIVANNRTRGNLEPDLDQDDMIIFHDAVLESVRVKMLEEIRREVGEVCAVAVILHTLGRTATEIEDPPKTATFLRYVYGGKVVERYIRNRLQDLTAEGLFKDLRTLAQEFGIEEKMLALCIDAPMDAGQLEMLQEKLTEAYPKVILTYTGTLTHMIDLRLRGISPELHAFGEQLNALGYYFLHNYDDLDFKNEIFSEGAKYKNRKPTFSKTCSLALAHRGPLSPVIEEDFRRCRNSRRDEVISQVHFKGIWLHLRDLTHIFLTPFFEKVWAKLQGLEDKLRKNPEADCDRVIVELDKFGKDNLEKFWTQAVEAFKKVRTFDLEMEWWCDDLYDCQHEFDWFSGEEVKLDDPDVKKRNLDLVTKVVDSIRISLQLRASTVDHLKCFQHLADLTKFLTDDNLSIFENAFPGVFTLDLLKKELTFLQPENYLDQKSLDGLLNVLTKNGLSDRFPELTRLANFALTFPTPFSANPKPKPSSRERAVEFYQNELYEHLVEEDEFYLRVEGDYCGELLARKDFEQRCIEHFRQIYRSPEEEETNDDKLEEMAVEEQPEVGVDSTSAKKKRKTT